MSHPGSKWFSFSPLADTDYYPTDGNGLSGSGSLTTASELKNCTVCILDALVVTLNVVAAGSTTWTVKDAAGTTVRTFSIPNAVVSPDTNPKEVNLGIQISGLGGFTVRTSDANCIGIALYRHIFDRIS